MAKVKERKQKGLGADKAARKFEKTSAEDRAKANSDGRFGYFDEQNKRYVPAIVDMIDGGNRDASGSEFAGGPLSNILNNLGISPYGSRRERQFGGPMTPLQAAVAGAGGGGGAGAGAGAGTGAGTGASTSTPFQLTPEQKLEQILMNQSVVGSDPRNFPRGTEPTTLTRFQQAALNANPAAPMQDFAMGAGSGPIDDGAEGAIGVPITMPDFAVSGNAPIDDGAEGAIGFPNLQYGGRGSFQMPKPDMQYGGRGMAGMPAENVNANSPYPTATAASTAAQNEANKRQMRINMGTVTREQYDSMSNAEKRERGLPVGGLDLAFAGADAFAKPMQYSGRGTSAGGFSPTIYANMIEQLNKIDPDFVNEADPATLMDMYSTYAQNAGQFY